MKRILLETTDLAHEKLTWDIKWVSLFESPWGIIEKIKHANIITSRELMKICGTDYIRGLKSNLGLKHRDLFDLNGFDDTRFNFYFGFSIKEYNKKLIEKLCQPLFDGDINYREYFHNTLYICPSCIKRGYHSIFHQFKIIEFCPFHHNEKLEKAASKCIRRHYNDYRYEISNTSDLPFHCNCGSCLLENHNVFFPNWYRPKMEDIKQNHVEKWLSLSKKEIDSLKGIYFLKNEKISMKNDLIENLLDLLSGELEVNIVVNTKLFFLKRILNVKFC